MLTSQTRALWINCTNILFQAVIIAVTFVALVGIGFLSNFALQMALKSVNAGEITLRVTGYIAVGYFVLIAFGMMVLSIRDVARVIRATFS